MLKLTLTGLAVILFVIVPHVALIVLAVRAHKRRTAPVKLLPESREERILFGSRLQ